MRRLGLWVLFILSLFVLLYTPFVGLLELSFSSFMSGSLTQPEQYIFWQIRLPRVFLAWIAGAMLALCGMLFQALCRNPLASPDILGVTTGASFGAVLLIRLASTSPFFAVIPLPVGAFIGAVVAVIALLACVAIGRGMKDATLLLAGVAMNFLFSSLTMIVQYSGNQFESFRFVRWALGGIQLVGFSQLVYIIPVFVLLVVVTLTQSVELDLLVCGEDLAISRGVNVDRLRWVFFFVVSLSVAVVVALCGPISFIGLMAPHICRLIVGGGHRYLAPATLFFGGFALTLSDTLARTMWAPVEIPVGILTSTCGAPFFLWLLLRKERGR